MEGRRERERDRENESCSLYKVLTDNRFVLVSENNFSICTLSQN